MSDVPLWLRMQQPLDAPIRHREEQERIAAEEAVRRMDEFFESDEGKQALREIWEGLSHEHKSSIARIQPQGGETTE